MADSSVKSDCKAAIGPAICLLVLIGIAAGFGALYGVLSTQYVSCCAAVRACWDNQQGGTITSGPCIGPLSCGNGGLQNYYDKCIAQQTPVINLYALYGTLAGVGVGFICMLPWLVVFVVSTIRRKRGYEELE